MDYKSKTVVRIVQALVIVWSSSVAAQLFEERAFEVGIPFVHFNGMSGELYFPEMMGAGAAFFDADDDGDLDLYLIQGAMLGDKDVDTATFAPRTVPLHDRLYLNQLDRGKLAFVDQGSQRALASTTGYGMGVATGDYDGDGDIDLYLANFGRNQLLRNDDGSFVDVTTQAGVDDERWSVAATFFDYNGDGRLDLYVANYVDFSFGRLKACRSQFDTPDYCSPQSYQPVSDRLFRNVGNGQFVNASREAGIAEPPGPGLGVVAGDFNGDAHVDLYVANDGAANFLWLNQGNGRFQDEALLAGVAVNMAGVPEASMGVDAADHDADGDLDLFMTHLHKQTNTLYINDGQGWFSDETSSSVLGSSSVPYTGFGTLWFDYDNDGWLDLLSANGAVIHEEEQRRAGEIFPLKQPNQLWRNLDGSAYADVSSEAGEAFVEPLVSRGAAFGDVDNDGDVDVLITNNAGPAQLFINKTGSQNSWIGFDIRNAAGAPALGTLVEFESEGQRFHRRVRTDGSYVSAHDPRVLIGLGGNTKPGTLKLTWPDGTSEEFADLKVGQYHTIRRQP